MTEASPPTMGYGPGKLTRDGTGHMVGGTVLAALGAYGFQLLGGRVLGPVEFAPITVLWTIQFLIFTVIFIPLEQLVIRRLVLAPRTGARTVVRSLAVVIGCSALAAGIFALLTLDLFFLGEALYAPLAVVLILGYGTFAVGRGALAGRRRFRSYGLATGAESMVRLAAAAAFLLVAARGISLAWAMLVGPLAILAWWPRPVRAGEPSEEAPHRQAPVGSFLSWYVVAQGASQTILAAGPLVVGALGGSPAAISVFFVTFTLFRGPITMTYSLVARVLPSFTALATGAGGARLRRWALRMGGSGLALGAVGVAAGWWLGPPIVALLFGEGFRPSPVLGALAVGGSAVGLVALAANQILIARGHTARLAAAWVGALVVAALAVVVGPGDPGVRVGVGFLAGEVAALLGVVGVEAAARPQGEAERADV